MPFVQDNIKVNKPMMAQYIPKYISLPFLTIDIIHLQAAQPARNAAINPIESTPNDVSSLNAAVFAVLKRSIISNKASPKIGGITIRKENCASFSFLLPRRRPVAMVVPERESPGKTATACEIPMIKACQIEMFSFSRGFAK